ncbi:MAG: CsgG/HfaB family protein [Pseudomonadota bacterium]
MKRCFFLVLGFAFLLQSCATLEKPSIVRLPEQTPTISKTLLESSPARFLKRKVAVARFTNETKYGQSFFYDEDKNPIGKQAMDILSAKLAATGKFLLLERADIEQINRELKIGDLANLNISADYLIMGSISEFGRQTVSDVGIFSRVKKQIAHAKVNVRLADVCTGEIIYSEEGEGDAFAEAGTVMGVGARADYDSSLNDRAITAAISKLVSNLIENLLDKPWRSYLLAYENDNWIISGGAFQGIKIGDVFGVYQRGKKVKNPQTNMFIDLPGQLIAKIKVCSLAGNDPNGEISICSVVNGQIPIDGFAETYIEELKEENARSGGLQ